jgi:hypothetical protein
MRLSSFSMPALALALALVGCNGDSPNADSGSAACPATYTVGDSCQREGQRCPYATSMCGLKCTCRGGVWTCLTRWCECSCACGKILKSSCELLACSAKATNKCPTAASKHCEVLCWDAGMPDGGRDAGPDAKPDGPADLAPDHAPDLAPPDAAPDQTLDLPPDLPTPDAPAPDQTPDLPADAGADAAADAAAGADAATGADAGVGADGKTPDAAVKDAPAKDQPAADAPLPDAPRSP